MFIKNFEKKGFLYQCTDIEKLTDLTNRSKIAAYIGFDCTANSLHVGSLMQIMILRLLQQHGHKPIIILGGGTSKIGDPTGKDEARKALNAEEITKNSEGIKKSLAKFIKFGDGSGNDGNSDAILVNNDTWLSSLGYIEFLQNFGSFFSVNRMLSMDSVKSRLEREQHLSFLEFNYMLLQAYDFYHLNKAYNCLLQIGGSDQWGNIVMGVDFIRKLTGNETFGITTPLLTTSSGVKMGKSVAGAVWLNEDMLSPYDYFQYWRNCEDPDVIKFAEFFSELNDTEMQEFSKIASSNINEAKKQLAFNLTKLCHGEEAARQALEVATNVFELGGVDMSLPTFYVESARLAAGVPAFELLFEAGLAASKSEAKKLVRGAGVKVNDQMIMEENMLINASFISNDKVIKLSVGKKKHILVKIEAK